MSGAVQPPLQRVAILGCGLIGTQWDRPDDGAAWARTHAAAFTRHPDSTVVALCDHDIGKARDAAAVWGVARVYADPAALFAEMAVDIAVVAASSSARWDVVAPALAAGVKVVVIEKPLATTLAESRRLAAAVQASASRSIVNFSRRWDPSMRALRERILSGGMGAIQRLVGTYGKGLTNNASHLIDLAACLCNAEPVRARALGSPLPAGESGWSGGKDCALDAQVEYLDATGAQFHLTLLGTDQRAFTCFELRVLGTTAICELTLGGRKLMLTELRSDPNYAGYVIPDEPAPLPARGMEAMQTMAEEAVQLASGKLSAASCDVQAALRTALAVAAVQYSAQQDGRWIELAALTTDNLTGE